ncbi:MAG: sulfatase-like hydrolase/transferase [Planctomycetota bacterium]
MLTTAFLHLALLTSAPQNPPGNILVIVADDLGIDRVNCYGVHNTPPAPGVPISAIPPHTPVLDGLAARGIRFENAWSNPMCSPTRALIQAGRYSLRTGIGDFISQFDAQATTLDTDEHTTIADALDATHFSGLVGKWHLAAEQPADAHLMHPQQSGWDYFAGSMFNLLGQSGCGGPNQNYDRWTKVTSAGMNPPVETPCHQVYATTDTTDEAINFIQSAGSLPWMLMVNYNAPHTPLHVPDGNFHTYTNLSASSSDALKAKAMGEAVDFHIGLLLRSIPASTLANTTIIFTADNGTAIPAAEYFPSSRSKSTVYEGGVRVPMIVVSPETPVAQHGSVSAALVSAVDLYATIADLGGAAVDTRDSVSMRPYFVDPSTPSIRDYLYAERFAPNGPAPFEQWRRATRGPRYKYVRLDAELENYTEEFYDVENDILEQNNLLNNPNGLDDLTELPEFIRLKRVMDCEIPDLDPASVGEWQPAVSHGGTFGPGFNAVHLSLIPKGHYRGHVLAWDVNYGATGGPWEQRWSIVDVVTQPQQPTFVDRVLTLPNNGGDLFCAGHAWNADGNLFVAGGTSFYTSPTLPPFAGGQLTYMWVPPLTADTSSAWVQQADMLRDRWYPTVKSLDKDTMLVLGGRAQNWTSNDNTYEVFEVSGGLTATNEGNLYPGINVPAIPAQRGYLNFYPRMTTLKNGDLFFSGFSKVSHILEHTGGGANTWDAKGIGDEDRVYGTSVHLPNLPMFGGEDAVLMFGGRIPGTTNISRSIQLSLPEVNNGAWQTLDPLMNERWRGNAVVLPDARIFVVGGDRNAYPNNDHIDEDPVFNGLMLTLGETSPGNYKVDRQVVGCCLGGRTYHSTTLLMPDASVLIAGGDTREVDYQVYKPSYLTDGSERPVISTVDEVLTYDSNFLVRHAALSSGEPVDRVVLIRSGTVTHHTDHDQRYYQCDIVAQNGQAVLASMPSSSNAERHALPEGYYMLFLVKNGTPSVARWVKVQ